jgi:hypothetical protein
MRLDLKGEAEQSSIQAYTPTHHQGEAEQIVVGLFTVAVDPPCDGARFFPLDLLCTYRKPRRVCDGRHSMLLDRTPPEVMGIATELTKPGQNGPRSAWPR